MLRELHISNLAVIEDATIELKPGLNVFTGTTGAGKSLIIGALELLLGLRSGGSSAGAMVRTGCDEARVSGLFEMSNEQTALQIGQAADQSVSADEPLLITRRLFASGRSSVSINGAPATAAMLRQVGQLLVDIHGQHEQQYLLKPSNQLHIIDAFSHAAELRQQFTECYHQIRQLQAKRQDLLQSRELREQQIELYEFQTQEIDAAELQPSEYGIVQKRYVTLSNAGRLKNEASEIHQGLYDSDGAVVEKLQIICRMVDDIAKLDGDNLSSVSQMVHDATEMLQDAAFEVDRYVDNLDLDPEELAAAEERLDTLNRLIHKYVDGSARNSDSDPVDKLLACRDEIGVKLAGLRNEETDLSHLDTDIARLQEQLADVGLKLTNARLQATRQLKPLVEGQLAQLGMSEATFDVQVSSLAADDPNIGPTGLDQIEFMVRTNPGQDCHPLRQIASGGEMSRIMLAIKSILADSDRISVLVFDEIDANIGGRLGSVIGKKMRQLAHGISAMDSKKSTKRTKKTSLANSNGHQVLCITHLSQIAAFGDNHLHISKEVTGTGKSRQTRTTVKPLEGDARITELAEMMAGKDITDVALAQAKEMLQAAL